MKKVFCVTYAKTYLIVLLVFAATLCFGASSGYAAPPVKAGDLAPKIDKVLEKLDAVSCAASGFIDNLDGTLCDCARDLMWEKKTGTVGVPANCTSAGLCPDPHDVNNTYSWSSSGLDPDGTAYTVFLAQLNDEAGSGADCFAGYCDWRLPGAGTIPSGMELESIVDLGKGFCGDLVGACINPIFGPTGPSNYWSSTTLLGFDDSAFCVNFSNGIVDLCNKSDNFFFARAVRPCS